MKYRNLIPFLHSNGAIIYEQLPYQRYRISTPLANVVADALNYPVSEILIEFPANWLTNEDERVTITTMCRQAMADFFAVPVRYSDG